MENRLPEILVVDDKEKNLHAVKTILKILNTEIITAKSGNEALKILRKKQFAVILLDVQMPKMNGFEVAELIRSREATQNIPIIFITAISKEDQHVFKGYEVGAVDYLFKPINPDILINKVRIFLQLFRHKNHLEELVQDRTSQLIKRNEELISAKKSADNANLAKSQFLANMSHELRTPMNGVLGFINLCLMKDIPDEQRKYLELAKISADKLLNVMGDILDFSKIEADKLELEIISFNFRKILDDILVPLEPMAREKDLSFSWHVDNEVPDNLTGDSTRLSQVITNLVENAIKFTKQGSVEVFVKIKEIEAFSVLLYLTVKDSGIGIANDKQDLVFQAFSQADISHTRKYGGTGLGLAIASNLVKMMGGDIWLESSTAPLQNNDDASGQGSCGTSFHFTARFDFLPPEAESEKIISLNNRVDSKLESKTKQLNILLVEDDFVNRLFTSSLIEDTGWQVTIAENGKEALQAFLNNNFDLILMDIQMPVMDGFEATAAIRKNEKETGDHIPIIAMTAHALTGVREKCLEVGMDDYITKPVKEKDFFSAVDRHYRNK
jgi:two-component system, sensor histidine kinase